MHQRRLVAVYTGPGEAAYDSTRGSTRVIGGDFGPDHIVTSARSLATTDLPTRAVALDASHTLHASTRLAHPRRRCAADVGALAPRLPRTTTRLLALTALLP